MREISIRQEEQSRSRRTDHSAYLSDHSSIHLTIHPVQIITTSPKRMNMHVRWYLFKWKTFILLLFCCLAAAPRNPRSGLPSFIILWGWFGTFSTINIIIPAGCRKRQRSNLFLFSSSLEIYLYLLKDAPSVTVTSTIHLIPSESHISRRNQWMTNGEVSTEGAPQG